MSGVTVRTLRGRNGLLEPSDLDGKIRPDNQHYCITRLLCVENTTNHGGGRAYPLNQMDRVSRWARQNKLKVHVDGARLFNACVAKGYSARDFAQHADTVSICFSKGLGCPMGSILVGDAETIRKARRARKMFGGALRQAGMMAASALYALEHNIDRLEEDHDNARAFADAIAEIDGIKLNPADVETNLVFFEVDPRKMTGAELSARLREKKVIAYASGNPQRLRACTHLDVTRDDLMQVADILRGILEGERVAVGAGEGLVY